MVRRNMHAPAQCHPSTNLIAQYSSPSSSPPSSASPSPSPCPPTTPRTGTASTPAPSVSRATATPPTSAPTARATVNSGPMPWTPAAAFASTSTPHRSNFFLSLLVLANHHLPPVAAKFIPSSCTLKDTRNFAPKQLLPTSSHNAPKTKTSLCA